MIDCQIFFMRDMTTNEAITENEDGSYTIFINDNLCEAKKQNKILHALKHIYGDDFRKSNVQEIEHNAHK